MVVTQIPTLAHSAWAFTGNLNRQGSPIRAVMALKTLNTLAGALYLVLSVPLLSHKRKTVFISFKPKLKAVACNQQQRETNPTQISGLGLGL